MWFWTWHFHIFHLCSISVLQADWLHPDPLLQLQSLRQDVLAWLYPSEHQPGLSPAEQIDTVCANTPVANANALHLLILIHLAPADV